MVRRLFSIRALFTLIAAWLGVLLWMAPAQAASVDPYVLRYLKASEPVPLVVDEQGNERLFSPEALTVGKRLFEQNCQNCHVGGATLPNPSVSLSLDDLKGAAPSRDTIDTLVAYFRHPMSYDGSEETYWCREVPESWLSQEKVENLAAFILRAAEKAPGWGTETF